MNLTKRETIAAMAMQGLLSNPNWMMRYENNGEFQVGQVYETDVEAVRQADMLIAELDRTAPVVKESLTTEHHIPDAGKMVPGDDGWIDHVPTDPIPGSCEKVRFSDGYEAEWDDYDDRCWNHTDSDTGNHIIKWRPAR